MYIKMKINTFICASRVALWLQKLFSCMKNFRNWKITFFSRFVEFYLLEAPYLEGLLAWSSGGGMQRDCDLTMTLTSIYVFWADPSKFCDPDCIGGSAILQQDQTHVSTFQSKEENCVEVGKSCQETSCSYWRISSLTHGELSHTR